MSDQTDLSTEEEVTTEAVETVEPVQKSMDDTIRETLDAINARDADTEETKESRQRDDKGRFAKTEGEAEPVAEPVAETTEAAPVTVPPELQRLGLRKDEAEAFSQAPEVLKQAFLRRSDEMHKGLEQFRTKAQFGHDMEQAITPFMNTITQLGVHPAQAVQKLMTADHNLRYGSAAQKQQMIMQIAQDYGVDLNFDPASVPHVDPNVSALQQQIQQLQGWIHQRTEAENQRERATLNSEIAKFASDPANSYFEQVKAEMIPFLQSGISSTLQDAYERAIYSNPAIRAQVLAKQQADAEAKRKAEAVQKAQDAKRAAVVNVPRRGAIAAARPVGSMDDTIRETARSLGLI